MIITGSCRRFSHTMGACGRLTHRRLVVMTAKLGIAAFVAMAVVADSENALQAILRTDKTSRNYSHHYLYLNADVNRHYSNEVIFAGRYLGADPDPGVRLNLLRDRPDNR
jgi:hypothetical protein